MKFSSWKRTSATSPLSLWPSCHANVCKSLLGVLLILCLSLTSHAFAADSSEDNTGRDDTQVFHIYEDVDIVSTMKLSYDRPRITVKAIYPQLQSGMQNESIDTFNQLVLQLMQQSAGNFKSEVAENQEVQQELPKSQIRNDLFIDYATSFLQIASHPLMSVRFSVQGYISGLAHPTHHHLVLNYDLKDNKTIELAELFKPNSDYLKVLSDYTSTVLYKHLRDKQMIADGTAPKIENFKNWNIKPNGLLITFDEYQVAPYIDGAQTVLVPYSELKDLVASDSLLKICVEHPKRCSYNNVLTGGFIDTAINVRPINTQHRTLNPILGKL